MKKLLIFIAFVCLLVNSSNFYLDTIASTVVQAGEWIKVAVPCKVVD
jgi:hypothetical protein